MSVTNIDDKARRAKAILDDDVFKEAVAKTRQYFRDEFENSQPEEIERRENAYNAMRGFDVFVTELQNFIMDAKVASKR